MGNHLRLAGAILRPIKRTFFGLGWTSGLRNCVTIAVLVVACSGCAAGLNYSRTSIGTIEGNLDVRWVSNDCFLFIPAEDPTKALRFTRAGSDQPIQPRRRMYTDGGSIPRVLWAMPQFSPWGYAPGYIIHDWLFEAHRCNEPYDRVTFEESATILAEVIKTQMELDPTVRDVTAHYLIYKAVASPLARKLWNQPRACDIPPEAARFMLGPEILKYAPVILRVRNGRTVPADGPLLITNTEHTNLSAEATLQLAELRKICGTQAP